MVAGAKHARSAASIERIVLRPPGRELLPESVALDADGPKGSRQSRRGEVIPPMRVRAIASLHEAVRAIHAS
jgi:hypothetical protein